MTRIIGILSTLFSPGSWRSYVAAREGRAFDARYGTDTRAIVPLSEMREVNEDLVRHAVQYEASAIPKFRRGLAAAQRALGGELQGHTFIDFGSGKGLVVMLASRLPFKQVWGVEMTPSLHAIARENVDRFTARAELQSPIHLLCADALTVPWPNGNVVAYLYNPFDHVLMARFLDRIQEHVAQHERSVMVIYVNPVHRSLVDVNPYFRTVFEHHTLCVYECARVENQSRPVPS